VEEEGIRALTALGSRGKKMEEREGQAAHVSCNALLFYFLIFFTFLF